MRILFVFLILTLACSPAREREGNQKLVEAVFEIDESLISTSPYFLYDSAIQYQVPNSWIESNANFDELMRPGVQSVFVSGSDSSILVVGQFEGKLSNVSFEPDTTDLNAKFTETSFLTNDFEVKQGLLQKQDIINFKLYFDAPAISNGFYFEFYVKPSLFDETIKSIESSIGSIKFVNQIKSNYEKN
ncbi:MAG: hypothetical protein AAF519_01705 [Bacteroidota bacterium]